MKFKFCFLITFFLSSFLYSQDLEPIFAGTLIPGTSYFVSGGAKGQVIVWDDKKGEEVRRFAAGGGKITSLVSTPKKEILAANGFGEIFLCSLESGKIEKQWKAHDNFIRSLAYIPNLGILFSTGDDNLIKQWDLKSVTLIKQIKTTQERGIRILAVSGAMDWLASGAEDGSICLIDPSSGQIIKKWKAHEGAVQSLTTIPSRPNALISAGSDKTLKLWNTSNGSAVQSVSTENISITSITPDMRGSKIACGAFTGELEYRDAATLEVYWRVTDHLSSINQVLFLPMDRALVSFSEDQTIKLWNLANGQNWGVLGRTFNEASPQTMIEPEILHSVTSAIPLPENRWGISRNWLPFIIIDDKNKIQYKGPETLLACYNSQTNQFFLALSGGLLGLYKNDLSGYVWQKKIYEKDITAMCFSKETQILYLGTEDGSMFVIDGKTGAEIKKIRGHSDQVRALTLRPGVNELASSSDDHKVIRWDTKNLNVISAFENHVDYVRTLAYSPQGDILVSGGDDLMINVYNLKTNRQTTLTNQVGYVYCVNFSPDGKYLTVIDGQSLVTFDINKGTRLKQTPWPGQKPVFFTWTSSDRAAVGTESGQFRYGFGSKPEEFNEFIGQ